MLVLKNRLSRGTVLLILGLALYPGTVSSRSRVLRQAQESALPAPLSGFSDEGKFLRFVGGELRGTVSFRWQADGTFENRRAIPQGSTTVTGTTRIVSDREGHWTSIELDGPEGMNTIVREAGHARLGSGPDARTVALRPGAALFGPLAPVLMSQLVRRYDPAAGGRQRFPVFVFSTGNMVEVALEKKRTFRRAGNSELELAEFLYSMPRMDFTLWVDRAGRIYLADSPSQKVVFVREGYEALRQSPEVGSRSQGLKGFWQGVLQTGAVSQRLALNVAQSTDGTLTGTFDSPDQSVSAVPLDTITIKGTSVRIEIRSIGGTFEGALNEDGSELAGQWQHGGQSTPLRFRRPGSAPQKN